MLTPSANRHHFSHAAAWPPRIHGSRVCLPYESISTEALREHCQTAPYHAAGPAIRPLALLPRDVRAVFGRHHGRSNHRGGFTCRLRRLEATESPVDAHGGRALENLGDIARPGEAALRASSS